jgi:hypothetical protein
LICQSNKRFTVDQFARASGPTDSRNGPVRNPAIERLNRDAEGRRRLPLRYCRAELAPQLANHLRQTLTLDRRVDRRLHLAQRDDLSD